MSCPHCNKQLRIKGYMGDALRSEKVGERVLTKKEIKEWKYPLY